MESRSGHQKYEKVSQRRPPGLQNQNQDTFIRLQSNFDCLIVPEFSKLIHFPYLVPDERAKKVNWYMLLSLGPRWMSGTKLT